ncbi:ATP-binding protein [Candidatus Bathyarchaeota archaeon B24-2]|nr:MAG: ATP-binding protein [Candidatus Bathyarchaeota archaeon B24-2]
MSESIMVSNLTKRFGELVAVDHISFKVKRGEFFGFLGPNGAGKTTTIRMLTGVIKPDEGTALVMGYDIERESIKAKQVMGIVPETANAYIDLTVWQNLMFMGELYGVPKEERKRRGESLLRELGLYDRRDFKVKGLSKGMKQRLLLCMALINEPEILFLDEPTVGLDVRSARSIREILQKLNEKGVTIFLTTHNMEEANQLCNRIAVINHGKIAAIDTPERLKRVMKGLQHVEVSFDKPTPLESLAKLPYVNDVRKIGNSIRLYTDSPCDLVCYIVDYVREKKLKLISLEVLNPKLEDVYLKLIEGGKQP